MKLANNKSLQSQTGFNSPGFTVDAEGNITALSVSISGVSEDAGIANFNVTDESADTVFRIQDQAGDNPSLTLARGTAYVFNLTLSTLQFYIKSTDTVTNFNSGLIHSSGTSGAFAQGLSSGKLSFTIPLSAPDILYYSNGTTITGTINVINPVGLFSDAIISNELTVEGNLILAGVGSPQLTSATNLTFSAGNEIKLLIDENLVGSIDSNGLSIPINTSNIVNSSIENSAIGISTPATAAFTSATIATVGNSSTSITNKTYVDSTATSLAIAFGL
jgi:hypothetical protein|tara:strand:- start:1165 stop:1992 length:828 start_codon:yes stop_codon:yes gene_type:complete